MERECKRLEPFKCNRVYFVKEGFTPLHKIHMTAAHLWQSNSIHHQAEEVILHELVYD